MRKLIVTEYSSLDGVMEAPGGEPEYRHTGWVFDFHGPEHEKYKFDELQASEAQLFGRRTYQGFAGAWPSRDGDFADAMNAMPKYVVSSTLTDPEWNNTTVVGGDAAAAVTELKSGDGGPILVAGSCQLVHTLIENDLVDELRLMTFPVILGSGKRVFPDGERAEKSTLKLTDAQIFSTGVVATTYQRA